MTENVEMIVEVPGNSTPDFAAMYMFQAALKRLLDDQWSDQHRSDQLAALHWMRAHLNEKISELS